MKNIFDRFGKHFFNKDIEGSRLIKDGYKANDKLIFDFEKFLKQELKTIIEKTVKWKIAEKGEVDIEEYEYANGYNDKTRELIQTYKDLGLGDILKELNIK